MTVTAEQVAGWVDRYVGAWNSNDPDDIASLFTADARYYTSPYREPWEGVDAIVSGWLERDDKPGTWTFAFEVDGVSGDAGYVRGRTLYTTDPPENYSNLWKVTLQTDGRCSEFIEWWMDESGGSE